MEVSHMRQRKRLLLGGSASVMVALVALLAFFLAGGFGGSATAGSSASAADPAINQYSAKFLCGTIASPATGLNTLAPGVYNTAVNIHNPNNFDVTIQKKAVVAVEENTMQGSPPANYGRPGTRTTAEILPADTSMEVDCSDIAGLTSSANPPCPGFGLPPSGFCKGFVVVEAARVNAAATFPAQLDVVGILTVKEEDGLWKDYTFTMSCLQAAQCMNNGQIGKAAGVLTPSQPFLLPGGARPIIWGYSYNWPDRPLPTCYNITTATSSCAVYDADELIRQKLNISPYTVNDPFLINVTSSNIAPDSRDVSLDYEFVSPKLINYPCWPKNIIPGCP
jgi:hypothetical protein